jgi:hypothetical protein
MLLGILVFIFLHSFLQNRQKSQNISSLTTLPSLSLGASYLEPRFRVYDEDTKLYPQMMEIDFMDYVYE